MNRLNRADAIEEIKIILKQLDSIDLINIYRTYCTYNTQISTEEKIYAMDEFDFFYKNKTPTQIALSVCQGQFNVKDDYFYITQIKQLISISNNNLYKYIEKYVNFTKIAEYCIENKENFCNENINQILKILENS